MLAGSTMNNGIRSYGNTNNAFNIFPGVVNIYINRITRKDMSVGLVDGVSKRGKRVVFRRAPLVAVLILAPVVSGVGLAYVVSIRSIPDVSNHVNSNVAVLVERT